MDPVANACIEVFDEIDPGTEILVGFSGGMDSSVLLHAVMESGLGDGRVTAVHVNHALAEEADRWQAHCESFAGALGAGFIAERLELAPGANLEARARTARYGIFEALLAGGRVLLLAHHLDDRDESVLLHLFQGRGLFGMPRQRWLGEGRLMRPLLGLPRVTLAAYAEAQHIRWIEDPANLDPAMDRNFLRSRILPALKERFPSLNQRFDRVLALAEGTDRALVEALGLGVNPLPLSMLDGLSNPAALSILRHWLVALDAAAGVSDAALADFLGQLGAASDRQPVLAIPAGELRRHRRALHLLGPPPVLQPSYEIDVPGTLSLPHGTLTLHAPEDLGPDDLGPDDREAAVAGQALLGIQPPLRVVFLDSLEAEATIRVRSHQRRPVELMREAGVPPWQRRSQPLLADRAGLLAVAGVAARDAPMPAEGRPLLLDWRPLTAGRAHRRGGPDEEGPP